MGDLVVNGAMLQCTMGTAPGNLMVLPMKRVNGEKMPAATIMEIIPFANITGFVTCMSMSNPITASLTAAALGVLTPGMCIPTPAGAWKPGALKTKIGGIKALTKDCTLNCAYGGTVTIKTPVTTKTKAN